MTLFEQLEEITQVIRKKTDLVAEDALILGSGLGALGDQLSDSVRIPYQDLPHFPQSHVEGHAGNLVFGKLEGRPVIVMQGRAHFYEGWSPQEVTLPVRLFKSLDVKRLLVTNSAGGIDPSFADGNLMVIKDHLNLTGYNPLVGPNDSRLGPRFPDMTEAYAPALRQKIFDAAKSLGLDLKEGVYAGLSGPSYETPAEIVMLGKLGAHAVGMSTVPEVIVANHAGLEVAGISCITNMAAGISKTKLNHDEVKETADRVKNDFINLVKTYIQKIDA